MECNHGKGHSEKKNLSDAIHSLQNADFSRALHDQNILLISSRIGVLQTSVLAGICNHIPANFPSRNSVALEMFCALTDHYITQEEFDDYVYFLECNDLNGFSLSQEMLWQASQATGKPYINF